MCLSWIDNTVILFFRLLTILRVLHFYSLNINGLIAELEKKYGKLNEKEREAIQIDIERYIVLLGLQRSIGYRNEKMLHKALAYKDYSLQNKLKGYDIDSDHELMEHISRAQDLLVLFEQVERMKSVVMSLKQPTISEVRSYSKPPPAIQNVMEATYVLLGEEQSKLKVCVFFIIERATEL